MAPEVTPSLALTLALPLALPSSLDLAFPTSNIELFLPVEIYFKVNAVVDFITVGGWYARLLAT